MPGLETWSWIAAIAAVPVAIIGWFMTRKTNQATAGSAGTAIAGNVNARNAGIVTGHNGAVTVNVAVDQRQRDVARYEARYAILRAVDAALEEVVSGKMISQQIYQTFSKAVTDSRFLLGDDADDLVTYLKEVRDHAAKFQACAIALESMEALPPGGPKAGAAAAVGVERQWLIAQIDGLTKRFEPALRGLR